MAPLVSVCVVTYNHAKFVERCLKSIFKQDYPNIQIVISDDCSPDGTAAKIHELLRGFSSDHIAIKFFDNEKNLGAHNNVIQALNACEGKYIAFCEGDDYWFDAAKLSRQIVFMEQDERCSAVSGLSLVKKIDGFHPPTSFESRNVTLFKYICGFKSETRLCSLVVRSSVINDEFMHLAKAVHAQDNLIRLVALKHGYIRVLGRVVAVYRNEGQGAWNSQDLSLARAKTRKDLLVISTLLSLKHRFVMYFKVLFSLIRGVFK